MFLNIHAVKKMNAVMFMIIVKITSFKKLFFCCIIILRNYYGDFMAISKTDFINYSRCVRYAVLDKIKKEKFDADVSIAEYKKQEKQEMIEEVLGSMYDNFGTDEETDLVDVQNRQLEAMLEYYKQVELEAGRLTEKYFGGNTVFSKDTYSQECFDFNRNGIKYLCYVDVLE